MILWEYTYVQRNSSNMTALTDDLNALGMEGWEVVGFASADKTIGLNSVMAVLKRPHGALEIAAPGTAEGWLPDPSGRHPDRYWSGTAWTKWVRDKPGGTRLEDPPWRDLGAPVSVEAQE